MRRLKATEGEVAHLPAEQDVAVGKRVILFITENRGHQAGIVEDVPIVEQTTEHGQQNESEDAQTLRLRQASHAYDRGQPDRTGKNDEANGPRDEYVAAARQGAEQVRGVDLLIFDEELRIEDERPQQRKCVENRFEKEQQTG